MTDLWRMGASELAGAIRAREASCEQVIDAHLRRIEAVNVSVNAVAVVLSEQALDLARAADRQLASGADVSRLHGVPFTVKDNIDLVGTPTTQGARALSDAFPSRDAPSVERLRAAGAIPIGRTNLPTFGMGWVCESELWRTTVNPWDRSLTPGASSGGEAAALATGMSPLGLGNDGLGSLRWPAQCCGVCVLRTTRGRIPRATTVGQPDVPISVQLMEVDGPMARRVADLWAAFEVLAGPSWRDPWTVPAPVRGPDPAKPVRVAVVTDPAGDGTVQQVQNGVRKAASALSDAGYAVEEIEPPSIDLAAKTAIDMLAPDWQASSPFLSQSMPATTSRVWTALLHVAGDPDRLTAMLSYLTRQSLLRAWGEFQETHPLIVAPIFTDVPFDARKGTTDAEVAEIIDGLRMTIAINALGLPAVALPVDVEDDLPQAVHVIGPTYREDLCLDAAAALEAKLGVITPIDPR
jgi:amidase